MTVSFVWLAPYERMNFKNLSLSRCMAVPKIGEQRKDVSGAREEPLQLWLNKPRKMYGIQIP